MSSRHFVAGVAFLLAFTIAGWAWAQKAAKPLTEQDLVNLIELQIDEATIAGKISKQGIAFAVDEAVLKRLEQAGAAQTLLQSVQQAAKTKPAAGERAITFQDIARLLELEIDEATILKRLEKSPTTFVLDAEQLAQLKAAGASAKLLAALQGVRQISPQAAELITDFAIVLDCSGSMKELTPEGEAKMVVAKRVVTDLVQKIPDGLNVTFIIYGHEVYGAATDPRNCQAVKVARSLSTLDAAGKMQLSRLIAGLKPTGTTPIALSLRVAGEELQKNDAYCGLVLITDGLETCKGDPVAEAAKLAANPKLTFGVHVVGFGAKPEEDKALAEISKAGRGKYYGADSAAELTEALGALAKELEVVAQPPKKEVSMRRAIKVLQPEIEFPPYSEIQVMSRGLGSIAIVATGKYGEEIRIPSSTQKYDIRWVPKTGEPVAMLKDFTFAERKVVEIKPEEYLGLIKVNGRGNPKTGIQVYRAGLGSTIVLQECKKYGEIMVVPAEKVNIRVDDNLLEEGLTVKAGTLHELE